MQFSIDRRECKYPLDVQRWRVAARWAERFLPVERFNGKNDIVQVRTIYLDTPDLDSYREYVEDVPLRKKVRIRQYGYEGVFDSHCWVEVKIKNQGRTIKRRFGCTRADIPALLQREDLTQRVARHNAGDPRALAVYDATRRLLEGLELSPVVRVDFERQAFASADCSLARITLDRHLRFRAPGSPRSVAANGLLMEFKYSDRAPAWAGQFLDGLDLDESQRFSKFAHAIEALGVENRHAACKSTTP